MALPFPLSLLPFPAGTVYMLATGAYLTLALCLLAVALLLAIWPLSRRLGWWLAGGTIASVPFLLFFQFLSVPVIGAVFLLLAPLLAIWPGAGSITVAELDLLLILGAFVVGSVTGCITGWIVGVRGG